MFNDLLFRLRSLFRRETVESEADAELHFHFDQQVEKYLKSGLTREDAIRRARIEFGGHEQLKEEIRDARGVNLFETLFQDIRYGLRILGRTPVITSVALFSLALGIGANTAIFSLIDTVMLRLLPVQKPEELVQLFRANFAGGGKGTPSFTNPLWEQVRDRQDVFSNAFEKTSWRSRTCSQRGFVKLGVPLPPPAKLARNSCTSSSGFCTGKSRSITVSIKLKITVFAPMPRASEKRATLVITGVRPRMRSP